MLETSHLMIRWECADGLGIVVLSETQSHFLIVEVLHLLEGVSSQPLSGLQLCEPAADALLMIVLILIEDVAQLG